MMSTTLVLAQEETPQDSTKTGAVLGSVKLKDPASIVSKYEYDPSLDKYIYTEKVGEFDIKYPLILSPEEFQDLILKENMQAYFKEKVDAISGKKSGTEQQQKNLLPEFYVNSGFFETIFGGNTIEVIPQGSVAIDLGVRFTKNDNPSLSPRNRTNLGFDFDQRISLSLLGKVGERLQVTANYDTESTFQFQNLLKLEYTPTEDDILQKIEIGNVAMPINSSLITGAQSLFGVKTQFQFGNTTITGVFSEQRSDTRSVTAQGGGTLEEFELFALDYDEDRHFFLAQYFRDIYDNSLEFYPYINSPIQITRIEVWVTNRGAGTQNIRNIVALQDLGEADPANTDYDVQVAGFTTAGSTNAFPDNGNNIMNPELVATGGGLFNQSIRDIATVANGFDQGIPREGFDYAVMESARKLEQGRDYTLNTQLGYISLNQRLQNDEVIAVAFQYTAGGRVFQVGEFANDGVNATETETNPSGEVTQINNQALVMKMLKSSITSVERPVWDLMMKNIYAIPGGFQLSQEDFRLNILYSDPSPINYITPVGNTNFAETSRIQADEPLLVGFNMDRLNIYNDPQQGGDGFFDFIPGITVDQQNGLIIFTAVEPFGEYLFDQLSTNPNAPPENYDFPETGTGDPYNDNQTQYVFRNMYALTKAAALEDSEQNKFQLKGRFKSTGGQGIPIGAFNVPRGSVRVTAGGRVLQEGVDYTVNYQIGRVIIIDEALKASNIPIEVSVENQSIFGQQNKRFSGIDVEHRFNDNFIIGATFLNLNERPLTQKANYGVEPVNNTMWGLRGNYSTEVPFLTRMVNKLPNIDTDVPSNVSIRGEFAYLQAGTSKNADFQGEATSYVDDFEGSQTTIDMKAPLSWTLASVPEEVPGGELNNGDLGVGFNRAKLAWYTIDPVFYSGQRPSGISDDDISTNETRRIFINEIFPQQDIVQGQTTIQNTLDLAYYPEERGPYNNNTQTQFDANPEQHWGGIMRSIQSTNFEQANVEFIQFWLLDTFADNQAPTNDLGDLVINLGNISEDVLKDGRKQYENGLPGVNNDNNVLTQETAWGVVPSSQSLTYAFDADTANRDVQDVGFDGLNDAREALIYDQGPAEDPASDNYEFYVQAQGDILTRYKNFNGNDGNSPVDVGNENRGSTQQPDAEDVNRDQTMNTINNYFGYRIPIRKDLTINDPFVYDIRELGQPIDLPNGQSLENVRWIQFRIPVSPDFYENNPDPVLSSLFENPNNIQDLRSVRFMRMYLEGFSQPVVMRFGTLDLVRGDWRQYRQTLQEDEDDPSNDPTTIEVGAVNILNNEQRTPIPYVLPPGIQREQLNNNNTIVNLNEQSLTLTVSDLEPTDSRGVFKNIDIDMRRYKSLRMFLHAEALENGNTANGALAGFLRIGIDLNRNYYQIEVPLSVSAVGSSTPETVWPPENNMDFDLSVLSRIKAETLASGPTEPIYFLLDDTGSLVTDGDGSPIQTSGTDPIPIGQKRISISGNPTLGSIRNLMVGIKSNVGENGLPVNGEVWFNELRLANLESQGGWASIAAVDANIADFANVSATGRMSTIGFGAINQTPNERALEDVQQYDVVTNVNLGQLLPKRWGVQLPFNYSTGEELITPEYDPFYEDLRLDDQLNAAETSQARDSIERVATDYTKRKSINFIGVRKNRSPDQKQRFYDVENFDFSYSYNETQRRNYELKNRSDQNVRVGANYGYSFQPKYFQPLKNVKFLSGSKYLSWLSDLNFNLLPSSVTTSANFNRSFNSQTYRDVGLPEGSVVPELQQRNFLFDWSYALTHNLTRSLRMNFTASNNNIVRNYFDEGGNVDLDLGIWDGFWDVGDANNHFQSLGLTYELPISKIPAFSFLSATYNYTGDFSWQRGSNALADVPAVDADGNVTQRLGIVNTVQNANTHSLNTTLTMDRLYKYLGLEKKVKKKGRAAPRAAGLPQVGGTPQEEGKKKKRPKTVKDDLGTKLYNTAIGLITSVKQIQINYAENNGTVLPGYLPSIGFVGTLRPTVGFVFGSQSDVRFEAARQGWLTTFPDFNQQFTQVHNTQLDVNANVDLLKDLTIDLNANRTLSENFQENFEVRDNNNDGVLDYNPLIGNTFGNFGISTLLLGTTFSQSDEETSAAFDEFRDNRLIIAQRLAARDGITEVNPENGFPEGYGPNNQSVLLPAFLAAYQGKDASSVNLGAFRDVPVPNWTMKYTGLMNLKWFKKHFDRFSLAHGYRASYTINSFNTNLEFLNPTFTNNDGRPVDAEGNLLNETLFSNINLVEQFNPLIKVDLEMKNSVKVVAEVRRDRALSLSLDNNLLTETSGDEYILGLGYRLKDVRLKTRLAGRPTTLKGDINFRADLSLRDNVTVIRSLDVLNNQVTAGQKLWGLKLTADYALTKNLQAQFFYDHTFSEFAISTAFPQTTIRSGFTLRYNFGN